MDYVKQAAVDAIKAFSWWNYGLDEVSQAKSDDWAKDLADEVVAAIVEAERIGRGGDVRTMLGGQP